MPFDPSLLRSLRARQRLTQVELAEMSGVSRLTIANLEKPHADGLLSSIEKVAKALGVEERAFFSPERLTS